MVLELIIFHIIKTRRIVSRNCIFKSTLLYIPIIDLSKNMKLPFILVS